MTKNGGQNFDFFIVYIDRSWIGNRLMNRNWVGGDIGMNLLS